MIKVDKNFWNFILLNFHMLMLVTHSYCCIKNIFGCPSDYLMSSNVIRVVLAKLYFFRFIITPITFLF